MMDAATLERRVPRTIKAVAMSSMCIRGQRRVLSTNVRPLWIQQTV